MKFKLLLIIILLNSCNSPDNTSNLKFEIDTLFNKFEKIKTISYTIEFEYGTYDTTKRKFGKEFQYFEETNDTSGWMLNFNNKGFLNNKFYYHTVYNFNENTLYYYSYDGKFITTDFNNPPKLMPGTDEISSSLLTLVKFLKLTSKKYPNRIKVKDTIIDNKHYHLVSFSNPDGIPKIYDYPPMMLFRDTTYQPLKLAIDKKSYLPKYYFWGFTETKFSDFVINKKMPQKIWSKDNLPTFYNKNVPKNGYTMPKLIDIGKKTPMWSAKSINGITHNLKEYNNKPTLFVFFSTFCGACISEIPKLNNLHTKNKNLNVIGICFENNKNDIIDFIQKHKIEYTILYNADENIKEKYDLNGYPVNYLVDEHGYIKYSNLGNSKNLEKDIQDILDNN